MKPSRITLFLLLALCLTLVFAPTAQAHFGNQTSPSLAPAGRPHSVNFATSGLADGVSITISGDRTNNGGNSVPFILTFTSPGPSSAITAQPGSDIIYFDGYPDQYILGDTIFTLSDITPTSPFTAGLSGETTTVLGIYTSCTRPIFTSQPISTTVMIGESVSFSVTIADPASASYQWYKDDLEISGANDSTYTIDAAEFNDGGTYHVVVSNLCGSVQSDLAELTVSKLSQTIDFPPPFSPAAFGTSFIVSPTASSGLTVTLQASGGCQIVGNLVTMTSGSLDCTLTASQPGDDDYLPAADVMRLVAAAKADQYIDFPPPPEFAFEGLSFSVYPTTDSGLAVALTATGSCIVTGSIVTIISPPGACTLTASQAGDENYNPAEPVTHTLQALPPANNTFYPIICMY